MLTEREAPYTHLMSLSISFGIVFSEMTQNKRKYEMKKRAERQRGTRRRIVEATVELHRTRGGLPAPPPAEIAQRARGEQVDRLQPLPRRNRPPQGMFEELDRAPPRASDYPLGADRRPATEA